MILLFFAFSPNRDHPLQGLRGQVQRGSLRRDHLRGLQGVLPAVAEQRGQLPVRETAKLRCRSNQSESLSILSTTKMPQPRNVQRR